MRKSPSHPEEISGGGFVGKKRKNPVPLPSQSFA
jgi:hypothetical protein